ncbi:Exocyst complex component 8-like [Oopsacas minuta]|uniref:Exocyst complex component 8 n=1 Tax=Oopsacas minuta TaxID=111878 RepID=A0AAV7K0B2_9METZ|nr:Exocyst complex component 8-like [Oopsacas minuta]
MNVTVRELKNRLKHEPFSPDEFVQNLCISDTRENLEITRQKIQAVADETAHELKMNVYRNYQQFINTSKDVSQLETEMHQINHIMYEQEQLLYPNNDISTLGLTSTSQDEERGGETQEQREEPRSLAYLLEIVEGCSHLTDVPGRCVVFAGKLKEIDPETGDEMRKIRAFLLNDSLLIATYLRKRQRRGPIQFRFQILIELDNLAVVLVKDGENIRGSTPGTRRLRNAFKILKFPDSHLYSADSAEQKCQWISILEDTKRKYKAARAKLKNSPSRKTSIEDSVAVTRQMSLKQQQMDLQQDWIKEMPEQLDVLIAQRDFEKAVEQVERAKSYLKDFTDSHALRDVRSRIDLRIKQLGEALKQELRVSRGASLRGGPRASRRAVALLLRLDRNAQACELFLKNRSRLIRYDLAQQKAEGAIVIFIDKLSRTFIEGLQDTSSEFQQAFGGEGTDKGSGSSIACYSTFVVWCVQELKYFSTLFCKHSFQTSEIDKPVECLEIALFWTAKMNEIGMDLGHTFLLSLKTPLLAQMKIKIESVLKTLPNAAIDTCYWLPYDLINNETLLNEITEKMIGLGVQDFSNEVFEDGIIDLTRATVELSVILYDFTYYSLKITLPEFSGHLQDCLQELMRAHLEVLIESLGQQEDRNMKSFLLKSMRFLFATVIPCLEDLIEEETGRVTLKLSEYRLMIEKQHADLKEYSHIELPKKRSSVYLKRHSVAGDEI